MAVKRTHPLQVYERYVRPMLFRAGLTHDMKPTEYAGHAHEVRRARLLADW